MSKRFGRNQRRKMRAQLADIQDKFEKAVVTGCDERRRANELAGRLERWARDIQNLLGHESAFNEQVRRMEVESLRSFDGRLRLSPQRDIARFDPVSEISVAYQGSVSSIIEAAIYVANVSSELRGHMREQVRILLQSRNGDLGYVMNREPHHGWTSRDIEHIAQLIAREMANYAAGENTQYQPHEKMLDGRLAQA